MTKFEGVPLDLGLKVGWSGFRFRDAISLISETVQDTAYVTINHEKSYVGSIATKSVDLESL